MITPESSFKRGARAFKKCRSNPDARRRGGAAWLPLAQPTAASPHAVPARRLGVGWSRMLPGEPSRMRGPQKLAARMQSCLISVRRHKFVRPMPGHAAGGCRKPPLAPFARSFPRGSHPCRVTSAKPALVRHIAKPTVATLHVQGIRALPKTGKPRRGCYSNCDRCVRGWLSCSFRFVSRCFLLG